MRGRSYSPSPPRGGYGRRRRSPSPRGRYGGRGGGRDLPTSLLVRNLCHGCIPEDLRRPFGQFGPLKDIYLPKDYYTGEPRGFGFVQYVDPADAEEAKYQMDGSILLGRQLTVVFAEENRKKPGDMRARDRPRGRHYERRRSPPRYSPSPPPRYRRSRPRSGDYYSPPTKRRQYSRSPSLQEERRYYREQSYSQSPGYNGRARSPILERSPSPYSNGGGSRSRSPVRGGRSLPVGRPPSRSPSRSRSPAEYSRRPERDESPSP